MRGFVMPGVELDGHSVAGLSRDVVLARLADETEALRRKVVRVRVDDAEFTLGGFELDAECAAATIVDEVLAAGRTGSVWHQFRWRLSRFTEPDRYTTRVTFAAAKWEHYLDAYERAALTTPSEGALLYADGQLQRVEPRAGQRIERAHAQRALTAALMGSTDGVVSTRFEAVLPVTTVAAVDEAERIARAILAGPLEMEIRTPLTAEARAATSLVRTGSDPIDSGPPLERFTPQQLGPALKTLPEPDHPERLLVQLDPMVLEALLAPIRERWEQPAEDARFNVDWRGKITIGDSRVQTHLPTLDVERQLLAAAFSPARRGVLTVVEAAPPRITRELAESLNIHELVAQFTTNHPCCRPRVKNIQRIADVMDGAVVLPGETFSVNEHVGPRTAQNGFFPAPTIVHGEISDTVGGGVSQFATTLFNAVLNGGYAIVERQPHSYYFRRYPVGHEATLSFPKPDLIFKNDTQAGLLIKTQYGPTYIRVKLYGDKAGRRVTREVSKKFDIVDPKVEYELDENLDPEKAVVKKRGSIGWSVRVSRTITEADAAVRTETRKVIYNPRLRIVRVHPCKVPEGAPEYTGEECPVPESSDAGVPPTP
jgi:vancomycin resistance protein YoaR